MHVVNSRTEAASHSEWEVFKQAKGCFPVKEQCTPQRRFHQFALNY